MRCVTVALIALIVSLTGQPAVAGESTTKPAKAWATDLPAFLNTTPGDWIVGRSTTVALSAQEAESMARDDAASGLIARLRPQLDRRVDERDLARQVQAALARGDLIVERMVVSTDRPYGTIWNAAILVNASADKVEPLLLQLQHSATRERFRAVAGMAVAALLVAVVGLFYLLLNWLTRGFFRGRLALASVLTIAIGIVGITNLL